MRLVKFSLKEPLVVLTFWTILIILGLQAFFQLPVKFLPPTKVVDVSIVTLFPGAEKERVLDQVTKRLERDLMRVKGVSDVISSTQNERSQITAHFKLGVKAEKASNAVMMAVSQAKAYFPEGVSEPMINISDFSQQVPIMTIALTSTLPPPEFYHFVDTDIRSHFEKIEGVSRVSILGQRQRQAVVQLDLEKMKLGQVSAMEVVSRLQQVGKNIYIGQDASYTLAGEISSLEDLGSIVIRFFSNDKAVMLKDIAEIREEISEPDTYTYLNGAPCLFLELFAHDQVDILSIEKALPTTLSTLEREHHRGPGNLSFFVLANRDANLFPLMHDFYRNTWIATFVAIFLIWIVFKDFKSIFISCTSIPVSLCGTFLLLKWLGFSLNVYTVPAIVISVGLIIDDMIVIRENVFRHLEQGKNPFQATLDAMQEMYKPVIGTTCMIFAVSIPLILLRGNETGQHLENFGVTMLAAMGFSLLEAFTLGPLLCAYCLKPHGKEEGKTPIQDAISSFYNRCLEKVHAHPRAILWAGIGIALLGFSMPLFLATEELPASAVGNIEMRTQITKGIPQKKAREGALAFSKQIFNTFPDIERIGLRVESNNEAIYYIDMKEGKKRKLTPAALKIELEDQAQKLFDQHKLERYFVLADVIIPRVGRIPSYNLRLSSYDPHLLRAYTSKMYNVLKGYPGLYNLDLSSRIKTQEVSFAFDFNQMSRLGVVSTPLARELDILLNGSEPVTFHPRPHTSAVKTHVRVKTNLSPTNAKELLERGSVPNINNALIPFKKITEGATREFSPQITRSNGEEYIDIIGEFNRHREPHAKPLKYTEELIEKKLPLPKEVSMEWAGKSAKIQDMKSIEAQIGLFAFFFIYVVLLLVYESMTIPLVILISLPFSVAGSFFALLLFNYTINLCSIVGIVMAMGIAAKNGIILIDFTTHLIEKGEEPVQAVYHACRVRLRPILMTSFGVLLTTIPVVVAWDEYSKVQISLGVALIGGLITATLLTLFLLPVIFRYTYRFHLFVQTRLLRHFNTKPPSEHSSRKQDKS